MEQTKYHRKADEAARLGVGTRTLDRWVSGKVVPVRRIGRVLLFDPAEVDAALAARFRVAAVGEPKGHLRRVKVGATMAAATAGAKG